MSRQPKASPSPSSPPPTTTGGDDWSVTNTYVTTLDRDGLYQRLRESLRPLGVNAHNQSSLRTALDDIATSALRAVDLQRLAKKDEATYVMETEHILSALREQAKGRDDYKQVCGARPSREVVESFLVDVLGSEQARRILDRRRLLHDAVRQCDALVEELRGRRRSLEVILRSLIS